MPKKAVKPQKSIKSKVKPKPKQPTPKAPSLSSRTSKTVPKTKTPAKQSKPSKASEDSGSYLKLVTISPITKKPFKPASGKPVIYGIQKGKKIFPLQKTPQIYDPKEAAQIKESLIMSEVGNDKKKSGSKQVFFEVKTTEPELTKSGKPKTRKVKAGTKRITKDGKRVSVIQYRVEPVYKIKIQAKIPSKNQEWRQVVYQDGKRLGSMHPYFQKRNEFERVTADILNRNQAESIKGLSARTVKAFRIENTLKGKTINQALKAFRPPVADTWIKRNKITTVVVYGTATITDSKGEKHSVQFSEHGKRFNFLTNSLGRSLRLKFASMGQTYSSLVILKNINEKIQKKWKGKENLKKAREELYGFRHLRTDTGYRNIIETPLKQLGGVFISMNVEFMRDAISVKPPRKKTKKKAKKGTKP